MVYLILFHLIFSPAISCSVLSDIVNGRVVTTNTTVGSTARYICNLGLVIEGDESRTCQPNREWSGQEPICKRMTTQKTKYTICMFSQGSNIHVHLWDDWCRTTHSGLGTYKLMSMTMTINLGGKSLLLETGHT